jgi:hypothetical protein
MRGGHGAGWMFWLPRNTLPGSWSALMLASRGTIGRPDPVLALVADEVQVDAARGVLGDVPAERLSPGDVGVVTRGIVPDRERMGDPSHRAVGHGCVGFAAVGDGSSPGQQYLLRVRRPPVAPVVDEHVQRIVIECVVVVS